MAVPPGAYLILFFLSAALSLLAGWIGWWGAGVLSCPVPGEGTFLAYCRNERYGDFEHGAFLYGLEPAALRNAAAADVVVIGNSRVQFGFSTDAARRYFAQRGVRHYLLGMGYASTSPFTQQLLEQHHLRPRVLIVNADPFFTDEAPSLASEVLRADARTRWDYRRKWAFQPMHRLVCERMPALCANPAGGILRRIDNGEWIWNGVLAAGDLSVPFADVSMATEEAREAPRVAAAFVRDLGVDARCVIVTAVPGLSAESRRVASAIAGAIGAPAILPVVDGLSSLDGDHLNAASAERWSAAFLDGADPRLMECLVERR